MLHFVPAEQARFIVNAFSGHMAAGSYLVISAGTSSDPDLREQFAAAYSPGPLVSHPQGEIARWFSGMELVAPGLVSATEWRPSSIWRSAEEGAPVIILAGVAHKTGRP